MKQRLNILLGAGSTQRLYHNPAPNTQGMPSTRDLTEHIVKLDFPAALSSGVPFFLSAAQEVPSHFGAKVPVISTIQRALRAQVESPDFERILHAIEQLLSLSMDGDDAMRAFVKTKKQYDILVDPNLLRATQEEIVKAICSAIVNRNTCGSLDLALPLFAERLSKNFRINVFTLNYDDIIDRSSLNWVDGFAGDPDAYTGDDPILFDRRSFLQWRDRNDPLLLHLHGSVRFGHSLKDYICEYNDPSKALDSICNSSKLPHFQGGQVITAAPIISGLSKVGKLAHNPAPFGYYYNAFAECMAGCDRLLVIGYGGRDKHVNTWIEEFCRIHGNQRKAVWICAMTGDSLGIMTDEKRIINSIAGVSDFHEYMHSNNVNNDSPYRYGHLGLVQDGFPISETTENNIMNFLI